MEGGSRGTHKNYYSKRRCALSPHSEAQDAGAMVVGFSRLRI